MPSVAQRLAGSPDLFASPMESVNFLTAHDGFTLYDLVAYDHRHNEANGWDNTDGHHDNRSWNSGWEGDDGVPDDVIAATMVAFGTSLPELMTAIAAVDAQVNQLQRQESSS